MESSTSVEDFYKLSPIDNKGEPFPFSQLKGKVVMFVNVASKCNFAHQYAQLETLYEKYRDQGFLILATPCNQFGQEPGDDAAIAEFCKVNFNIQFPILRKSDVNGRNASPVYHYLKLKKSGLLGFSGVKWNFEKFLMDRNGNVRHRWATLIEPPALESYIVDLLTN